MILSSETLSSESATFITEENVSQEAVITTQSDQIDKFSDSHTETERTNLNSENIIQHDNNDGQVLETFTLRTETQIPQPNLLDDNQLQNERQTAEANVSTDTM